MTPLPDNILRLVHSRADPHTKSMLAVAAPRLRLPAGTRRYIDGTGKYQYLWNVDRAIRRLMYQLAPKGFFPDEALEYGGGGIDFTVDPLQLSEFVRRCKERYKALARRGVARATFSQFLAARRYPDRRPADSPMDDDPGAFRWAGWENSGRTGTAGFGFVNRSRYGEAVMVEAFARASGEGRLLARQRDADRPLEGIMDAVLLFGKQVLDRTRSLMPRRWLRDRRPANSREKNLRRREHAWTGITYDIDAAAGGMRFENLPGPEARRMVQQAAARRRVARRAARRAAAAGQV